jgi:hypothetical protein
MMKVGRPWLSVRKGGVPDSRRFWAICLAAAVTSWSNVGCNPQPSDKENFEAKTVVTTAPSEAFQALDHFTVNRLIALSRSDDQSDRTKLQAALGTLFQFSGKVDRVAVTSDTEDKERQGDIVLHLVLPDYQAINVACYFHSEDEAAVRAAQLGSTVWLKGRLRGVSRDELEMAGCVFGK